ncbi:O-antigen ligase family protein [Pseudobutyrivibrio xylanivorans]|uniref:O-Antigen ligase n=1 Tax=Pseudobutyrivibrio xylanivorans DSM 14809 TaxID=1123012 RepID=A0A1M6JFQ8_PSEXY|nr:O-antigen ligase family protein [Pseudobutyrivibrio xylanivorans]SHJ45432.1 O-Antigen ligase [Pseudobutyrivibrio xylanivorans DSM 14809]
MQNEWLQTIQNMYWVFIFIIYPAIFREAYADIGNAKLIAFYAVSFLFIISNTIIFIYIKCKKQPLPQLNLVKTEKRLLATISLLTLITFIINGRYHETFFGINDYAASFLYIETLIIVFALIRTQRINEVLFCACSSVGLIIVGGIAFIQFLNYDFIHMYDSISPSYSSLTFLSTMSNVDCAGFYFAVMLPFSVFLLTKKWWNTLGALGIIMSTLGVIISSSDTALVGFIVEILLILLVSIEIKEYRNSSFYTLLFVTIGISIIYVMRRNLSVTRNLSSIYMLVTSLPVIVLLLIVSLLLLLINTKAASFKWLKILLMATIMLIFSAPVYIAIITKTVSCDRLSTSPFLSFFSNFLYFDNNWGSGRGYIWKCHLYLFSHGNIINILLGQGACSFKNLYNSNQNLFHDMYGNMYVDILLKDSHNMYLHFLFEYGLLNFLAVLSFLFCRLKYMKKSDNYYYRLKFCALVCAMVMAIAIMSYSIHMAFIPSLL